MTAEAAKEEPAVKGAAGIKNIKLTESENPAPGSGCYPSISFELEGGKVQEFQLMCADSLSNIQSEQWLDIDNDGELEYIIQADFGNTAAEYNIVYAFKFDGTEVIDISPDMVIPELKGDVVHAVIIDKEIDGKKLKVMRVCTYGKEDAVAYTTYDGIVYCQNGKWIFTDASDDDIWPENRY